MIFAVVDALPVDGRDPEVRVAELPLDDGERDALASHLDGVCVAKLMRRKASPDSSRDGKAAQFGSCRR